MSLRILKARFREGVRLFSENAQHQLFGNSQIGEMRHGTSSLMACACTVTAARADKEIMAKNGVSFLHAISLIDSRFLVLRETSAWSCPLILFVLA